MAQELVLVLDCGSTNITVIAVDLEGKLHASVSHPNAATPQENGAEGWVVWDMDALWGSLAAAIREIATRVGADNVRAVVATTWGADGAPVSREGGLTYPPICWQCPRTEPMAEELSQRLGARRIFDITGYQMISFNTLLKLIWLRRNAPEALDEADTFMMMPGLFSWKLCGEVSLDVTSASTMMVMDLGARAWSDELLREAALDASFFPQLVYPGEVIGEVTAQAAGETGLKPGTLVVAGGHDTQFAPIGSGASPDEVILSSGTWEILMVRTPRFVPNDVGFSEGLLIELDALPGLYDPQLLMMGSGVLEWIRETMYAGIEDRDEAYGTMIEEARAVCPGAEGHTMVPSFVADAGPTKKYNTMGTIIGLSLASTRGHIYRAALEGLCFQMKQALRTLKDATGFRPTGIRVVGGGSRNELWNRLRADVCRLPVTVTAHKEATVLGAAIAAWTGLGEFSSIDEGQQALSTEATVIEPSGDAEAYEELFSRYETIPPALQEFYSA